MGKNKLGFSDFIPDTEGYGAPGPDFEDFTSKYGATGSNNRSGKASGESFKNKFGAGSETEIPKTSGMGEMGGGTQYKFAGDQNGTLSSMAKEKYTNFVDGAKSFYGDVKAVPGQADKYLYNTVKNAGDVLDNPNISKWGAAKAGLKGAGGLALDATNSGVGRVVGKGLGLVELGRAANELHSVSGTLEARRAQGEKMHQQSQQPFLQRVQDDFAEKVPFAGGLMSDRGQQIQDKYLKNRELESGQVLAAPEGSDDLKKLQTSLIDAKYKANAGQGYKARETPINDLTGQSMPRASGTTMVGADGKSQLVKSEDPMDKESDSMGPKWSAEASTDPSSPFFGKSDHSGDEARKLKYIEQQDLLGNKPASYGHEGTTPEGLVKKGWTQDPDKMVDGWAKSVAANPQGLVAKDEDPGTKEMQHYKEVMSKEPEGSAVYKAAEKSLGAAEATYKHFNTPKQGEEGYQSLGQNQSVGGLVEKPVAPEQFIKDDKFKSGQHTNPEWIDQQNKNEKNPVSLMTYDLATGGTAYRENPDHTDVNTGRTRVQQHQYDASPEGKAEKEYSYLLDRAHHQNYMGNEDIGKQYAEQAAKLYDTFSKEKTQRDMNASGERNQTGLNKSNEEQQYSMNAEARFGHEGDRIKNEHSFETDQEKNRNDKLKSWVDYTNNTNTVRGGEEQQRIAAKSAFDVEFLKGQTDMSQEKLKTIQSNLKAHNELEKGLDSAIPFNSKDQNTTPAKHGEELTNIKMGLRYSKMDTTNMSQAEYAKHGIAFGHQRSMAESMGDAAPSVYVPALTPVYDAMLDNPDVADKAKKLISSFYSDMANDPHMKDATAVEQQSIVSAMAKKAGI